MPPAPLDARVAQIRDQPGRTWGAADAGLAVLTVPAALAVGVLLTRTVALPPLAAEAAASAALAGLAVLAARRAVRQSGGWQDALGLGLPEWSDAGRVLRWTVLVVLTQVAALAVLPAAVPALRGAAADNTSFLSRTDLGYQVAFALLAVTVAPVVEELLFRGLALRGLMLRLGFWPAAVLSSALFGGLHAQALAAGSALLAAGNGVLGLLLCVLARRSGRLGPVIGVHAVRNALAVALVVASAAS